MEEEDVTENYQDMTVEELRDIASQLEIEGRSGMNKAELIEAIEAQAIDDEEEGDGQDVGAGGIPAPAVPDEPSLPPDVPEETPVESPASAFAPQTEEVPGQTEVEEAPPIPNIPPMTPFENPPEGDETE